MDEQLSRLLEEGESFAFRDNCERKSHGTYGKIGTQMQAWVAEVEDFIRSNYGIESAPWRVFSRFNIDAIDGNYEDAFETQKRIILAALKASERIAPKDATVREDRIALLEGLFRRFHVITRQLRNRYTGRPTLEVEDEYDVQDLLHALLRIYFDDIRKEEWTPSYAGGSSRMDFLLKEQELVIEVKKTRAGLGDSELGKQLIEDVAKYKAHPECRKLICFTYDPEGRIGNPKGLQNDLNRVEDGFEVSVFIEPSHA